MHNNMRVIVIFCSAAIITTSAFVLPVQKCKLSDSACLKTEFQKAIPVFMSGIEEYGIEVMDEMKLENIQFDLSGLQFSLKNGRVIGHKNIIVDAVEWDTKRLQFSVLYHFVTGTVYGHYIAGGKVLVLPVKGEGDMTFHIDKLEMKITLPYDLKKGLDGKDYVSLKGLDLVYESKEDPRFNFTNLFDGNKELSDRMHAFITEHWKPLSSVFGRPLALAATDVIYKNMQIFFKKVALSDIAEY